MASHRPDPVYGPPALLDNRVVPILLAGLLLIPFFLPIPQSLRSNPVIGMLGDQVHVPLLAGLTLVLYWFGPLRGRLWYAALAALACGGAIEFLQLLVGRSALFTDFLLDLAGVGLAVGLVCWRGLKMRWGLTAMAIIALVLAGQLYFLPGMIVAGLRAARIFPVVCDFEGSQDLWLWQGNFGAVVERVHEESGNTYLRITGGPPGRWPGADMGHFPPDWTDFSVLKVDVRHSTPGKETVPFTIRLDDFRSRHDHVWISNSFRATTRWQTFRVPLDDRLVRQETRAFEFQDTSKLLFFLGDREDTNSLEIDNIRLE
ncbi:hypothetical protein CSA17_00525 [bacterium DOLJORAL78_65_58]|nr:MAG: hypothetical protein CSB20_07365 [bacterium DOLZORAL124_64_63]PIE76767.1 MAG: hypothetical protein CSA17_00525 [bacterium DOLJORAL78_65_58]